MTTRQIFFEQKMAENALRLANAKKMAEMYRAKGRLRDAKGMEDLAERLEKERSEIATEAAEVKTIEDTNGQIIFGPIE